LDDAGNDLQHTDVRSWRKVTRLRDAKKLILKEAKVMHWPYSLWRGRRKRRRRRLALLLQVRRSLVQMDAGSLDSYLHPSLFSTNARI